MRTQSIVYMGLVLSLVASSAHAEEAAPQARSERIKVAVLDLKANGVPEELAGTLTSVISSELGRLDVFSVISQQEIRALVSHEAMGQALGCEVPSCTTDLGMALGVRYLVTGNVGKVGQEYSLNLSLTNTEKAAVEGRQSASVKETSALLDTVSRLAKLLVSKVLGDRQGTLIVTCAEVGATVKIDGAIVGVTPLPRQTISWGPHLLEVEKKGFVTAQEDISMTTRGFVERSVAMIPSPDFLSDYQSSARHMRIGAWVTTAVAVAAIGTASYFQIAQTGQTSTYDNLKRAYEADVSPTQAQFSALQAQRDKALGSLDVTYTLIGVAAAAGAGAIYFWVAGADPDRYARYRGLTTPAPSPDTHPVSLHVLQGGLLSASFDLR